MNTDVTTLFLPKLFPGFCTGLRSKDITKATPNLLFNLGKSKWSFLLNNFRVITVFKKIIIDMFWGHEIQKLYILIVYKKFKNCLPLLFQSQIWQISIMFSKVS